MPAPLYASPLDQYSNAALMTMTKAREVYRAQMRKPEMIAAWTRFSTTRNRYVQTLRVSGVHGRRRRAEQHHREKKDQRGERTRCAAARGGPLDVWRAT